MKMNKEKEIYTKEFFDELLKKTVLEKEKSKGEKLKVYDSNLFEMMKTTAPIVNNFKGSLESVSFTTKTEGHYLKTITLDLISNLYSKRLYILICAIFFI